MEVNSDSFTHFRARETISDDSDSNSDIDIIDNSTEEIEHNQGNKFDVSWVTRKKKIQVILSSDEDEESNIRHSLPVQPSLSSSEVNDGNKGCQKSIEFDFPRSSVSGPKVDEDPYHVSALLHHPPLVNLHLHVKEQTKDVSPAITPSDQNLSNKELVSRDSYVTKSQSKEGTSFVVQHVSKPNISSVQESSNVQKLRQVDTSHSDLCSKGNFSTATSAQQQISTFRLKSATSTTPGIKTDYTIVISDTDDVSVVPNQQDILREKLSKLMNERDKMKVILRSSNVAALPDNGARLQMQVELYEKEIRQIKHDLEPTQTKNASMSKSSTYNVSKHVTTQIPSASFSHQAVARPLGKKALETLRVQRSLTTDALEQLHASIKSCPNEETLAPDPNGLKSGIQLMPHQKRALAWLSWRETQNPHGGILADDMGLGKTLTMISLIMKSKQEDQETEDSSDSSAEETGKENWLTSNSRKKVKGGTLVICPASLLSQWEEEVHCKCRRGLLDVEIYHGQQRDKPRHLAKKDIVITTYNLVRTEAGIIPAQKGNTNTSDKIAAKKGNLFQVRWRRIILDEAHVVRNHKSQTSIAVCLLSASCRWALTGTPIHNKELDLYALLKFLRCSPFDDYLVWRRWVDNKNASGQQRLNTVVNSIMLRRTKVQLQEKGAIKCLPEKHHELIYIQLDDEEAEIYQKVLIFSKTLFAQFLHQRAEKEQLMEVKYGQSNKPTYEQDHNLNDPFKLSNELANWQQKIANTMSNIQSYEILVLLLRLRQLCCHPSLITGMLEKETCEVDGIEDENGTDIDLLTQFSNLGLRNESSPSSSNSATSVEKNVLSLDNPVFHRDRVSSKMKKMLEKLKENIIDSEDKAIVVSQWTTMLDIVGDHLQLHGITCAKLTGAVPVKDRMSIVTNFNKSSRGPKVLLLSLTAGGVGLNLVGANHLFLFDLHWNPQLEAQACDRIYRFGQEKAVHVYKFVCEDTIEQRIKMLQDQKLSVATNVLSGAHKVGTNKLSLNDLKMLFSM